MFRDPAPAFEPLAQARTYSSDTVRQFLEIGGGGIVLFAIVLCAIIFPGGRSR